MCFFQHFAILLKYIIHVAIPDIPTWVMEEMAKLDYQRREAFKVKEEAICWGFWGPSSIFTPVLWYYVEGKCLFYTWFILNFENEKVYSWT